MNLDCVLPRLEALTHFFYIALGIRSSLEEASKR